MYTLGQAAKATGKSKTTIRRAIASGKISASKDSNEHYTIDPAELHRVYPPSQERHSDNGAMRHPESHRGGTAVLEAKLEAAERLLSDRQKTIDDLRERLDHAEEQRAKTFVLLTDQRTQTEELARQKAELEAHQSEPKRGFWGRLFGT